MSFCSKPELLFCDGSVVGFWQRNVCLFRLSQLAMRGAAGPMGMTGLPGRVVSGGGGGDECVGGWVCVCVCVCVCMCVCVYLCV